MAPALVGAIRACIRAPQKLPSAGTSPKNLNSTDRPRSTAHRVLKSSRPLAAAVSEAVKPKPQLPAVSNDPVECPSNPQASVRRSSRKLWEIPSTYHCGLLGIALGLQEMRRVAARIGIAVTPTMEDYEVHHRMINVARRADRNGRRLHRYLANKFAATTKAFKQADTDIDLRVVWKAALEKEELAAIYWAVLTHHAITEEVADEAFSHVHMFSHGAVGEIRRLQAQLADLKRQCEALTQECNRERQSKLRLRKRMELAEKDASEAQKLSIALRKAERDLHCAKSELAGNRQLAYGSRTVPADDSGYGFDNIADVLSISPMLTERYLSAARKVSRLAVGDTTQAAPRSRAARSAARGWRRRYRSLQQEIRPSDPFNSNDDLQETLTLQRELGESSPKLSGLVVAYVGGRSSVVPHLRELTERANAKFVHHDGGIDERVSCLDEGIARSDILVVPVSCVSHDAARRIKHQCRRYGTRIIWLRRASVSAFEHALHDVASDFYTGSDPNHLASDSPGSS